MTEENPTTGTIQGTCGMTAAARWQGRGFCTARAATDTSGVTRTGKDGAYVSEAVPPGAYVVRVEGRDMLPAESSVNVVLGAAATADFKLEWINPGPARLESKFSGDVPDTLPINGRNYLNAGQLEPGRAGGGWKGLRSGQEGLQSLSINSQLGRTTHYDMDEVEAMDETKGASTMNLPAEAVREVIVSRATPEVFQSLNAAGAVRVTTRSGGDEWHGNLFGNLRDRQRRHGGISGGRSEVQPAAVWIWGGRRGDQGQGVFIYRRGAQQAGWRFADRARIPCRVRTLQDCAAQPLRTRSACRALIFARTC